MKFFYEKEFKNSLKENCKDFNHKDYYKNTPLHIASLYNNHQIVKILITDCKCIVDERNLDGVTAKAIAEWNQDAKQAFIDLLNEYFCFKIKSEEDLEN